MNIFRHYLLIILLHGVAHAESIRQFTFSVYGQYPVRGVEYNPVSEDALGQGEQTPQPIEIRTHTLSRMGPYAFKGGNRVRFKDRDSGKIVASVSVSESSNQWIFIFVRNPNYNDDPDNNPRYLVYPFDDSRQNLPMNGLVFLNISGKALDGLLEGKRVQLGAGESDLYRVQESLPINLWTRDFSGERLLPALIKTYRFQPGHRYLMIFFPPVLRGSVDLDVRFLAEAVESSLISQPGSGDS